MKSPKTVKVGKLTCRVETLREWLNNRITSLRQTKCCHDNEECIAAANFEGRLVELLIIREKINDKRIQEIQ